MNRMTMIAVMALLGLAIQPASAEDKLAASIKLFQFQPKTIAVKAGTTIEWLNGDDIEHSVTSGAPGKETGSFDSGFFKKDGKFAFTFGEPGTFTYFCKRHPSMKATVTVTE